MDLQELIGQKVRLGILSLLALSHEEAFVDLADQLEVTDGNLSSHLKKLEKHGLVKINKTFEDKRPKTTAIITREGREEFDKYLDRIENLLKKHRGDEFTNNES